MATDNKYYVYIFFDPETNLPFYVGKGTGNRYKSHEKGFKNNLEYWRSGEQPCGLKELAFENLEKKGLQCRVELVENLNEDDALILEQALIAWFGRRKYANGVLTNKLCGGRLSALFFDEQSLIEIYNRPDLLQHVLRWPRHSKPWSARYLYFYEGENAAHSFRLHPVEHLYDRFGFEEIAIKTMELLYEYDGVITPLFWVRKMTKKKLEDERTYTMHEGLQCTSPYYFHDITKQQFESFLEAHGQLLAGTST